MARRSTPERIEQAWAAGVRNRLIRHGMSTECADEWLARWAEQAASEGVGPGRDYWDRAYDWITSRR